VRRARTASLLRLSPPPLSFISVPRDLGTLNCGAFVAGVVHGVLSAAGFPAHVSAYSAPVEGSCLRTNILMKFEASVLEREQRMG
jgi:trafficking protein particle complex subunit 5